jgi:hypothetical protein
MASDPDLKQKVRDTLDQLDEMDLADHAYWQMAHDLLGLDPGDIESMIAEDPVFFGAEDPEGR